MTNLDRQAWTIDYIPYILMIPRVYYSEPQFQKHPSLNSIKLLISYPSHLGYTLYGPVRNFYTLIDFSLKSHLSSSTSSGFRSSSSVADRIKSWSANSNPGTTVYISFVLAPAGFIGLAQGKKAYLTNQQTFGFISAVGGREQKRRFEFSSFYNPL